MADDPMASRVAEMPRGGGNANFQGSFAPPDAPQRNMPMVQSNKDKPGLPTQMNYQEVLNNSFDVAKEQQARQQLQQQQAYMQPNYEQYVPMQQQQQAGVQATFWSENRYSLIVFMLVFVSMYYVLPRLTALTPGKETLWLVTAAVAAADAWLFGVAVKYW